MDFDDLIDRRGTLSQKWDAAHKYYNVDPETCLPMWVADTDFRAPDVVLEAVRELNDFGVYAYMEDYGPYRASVQWWMEHRHGWKIQPEWIFTTFGIVNAICVAFQAYTQPGDGIVIFSPVYHSFASKIKASGRRLVEIPLARNGDRYEMDFEDAQARLTGDEKMIVACSPHNPVGRVWSRAELEALAEFARRNDLLLISDEIHHDLVYPGHKHIQMAQIDGITDRLITLSSVSKTFNLAGNHSGNAIIEDPRLRARYKATMAALGMSPNIVAIHMSTAAYSPQGSAWVDAQMAYLDRNRATFEAGVNAIPGVHAIPIEATFLSWVDFAGTGMSPDDIKARVEKGANIAASHGETFGAGGDGFLRFNIGTQHARIEEAVARLHHAFGDLQ